MPFHLTPMEQIRTVEDAIIEGIRIEQRMIEIETMLHAHHGVSEQELATLNQTDEEYLLDIIHRRYSNDTVMEEALRRRNRQEPVLDGRVQRQNLLAARREQREQSVSNVLVDVTGRMNENEVCRICLGAFATGECSDPCTINHRRCTCTNSAQVYGRECIHTWLTTNSTCPTCRNRIVEPHRPVRTHYPAPTHHPIRTRHPVEIYRTIPNLPFAIIGRPIIVPTPPPPNSREVSPEREESEEVSDSNTPPVYPLPQGRRDLLPERYASPYNTPPDGLSPVGLGSSSTQADLPSLRLRGPISRRDASISSVPRTEPPRPTLRLLPRRTITASSVWHAQLPRMAPREPVREIISSASTAPQPRGLQLHLNIRSALDPSEPQERPYQTFPAARDSSTGQPPLPRNNEGNENSNRTGHPDPSQQADASITSPVHNLENRNHHERPTLATQEPIVSSNVINEDTNSLPGPTSETSLDITRRLLSVASSGINQDTDSLPGPLSAASSNSPPAESQHMTSAFSDSSSSDFEPTEEEMNANPPSLLARRQALHLAQQQTLHEARRRQRARMVQSLQAELATIRAQRNALYGRLRPETAHREPGPNESVFTMNLLDMFHGRQQHGSVHRYHVSNLLSDVSAVPQPTRSRESHEEEEEQQQ